MILSVSSADVALTCATSLVAPSQIPGWFGADARQGLRANASAPRLVTERGTDACWASDSAAGCRRPCRSDNREPPLGWGARAVDRPKVRPPPRRTGPRACCATAPSRSWPVRGQRRGKLGRVEATRRGDRDQAASREHAMCLGKGPGGLREVVEDIQQRDRAEAPVGEGKRRGLRAGVRSGRPGEHLQRVVHADPRTFGQVACQLALAAADVEDRGQALGEQATSHPAVHVLAARVPAEDRPCEAEALRVAVVVGRDRPARLPAHLPLARYDWKIS